MSDFPPPPVPADLDLTALAWMPLDVRRLRDSELAGESDAVFRCSVLSWCAGWHQVPAGSLPDDDTALARLLGFGRDLKGWRKVRDAGGLRGWIKCNDGRLYHPVVAAKALEAMGQQRRAETKRERDAERLRKWRESHDETAGETRFVAERPDQTLPDRTIPDQKVRTPPSSSVVSPRADSPATTAAAKGLTKRIETADPDLVRDAIRRGLLPALLNAYGIPTADAGDIERDADGAQLGEILAILDWRKVQREPIRRASGFRAALEVWRAMPIAERKSITKACARSFLLMPENQENQP